MSNKSPNQTDKVVGTVVLIFLALIIIGKCSDDKPDAEKADDSLAYVICEKAIEQQLKSPSSADFAGYRNSLIEQSNKTFTIKSHVDSENSFGAKIRTQWSCSATYKSGDPYSSSNWSISTHAN